MNRKEFVTRLTQLFDAATDDSKTDPQLRSALTHLTHAVGCLDGPLAQSLKARIGLSSRRAVFNTTPPEPTVLQADLVDPFPKNRGKDAALVDPAPPQEHEAAKALEALTYQELLEEVIAKGLPLPPRPRRAGLLSLLRTIQTKAETERLSENPGK